MLAYKLNKELVTKLHESLRHLPLAIAQVPLKTKVAFAAVVASMGVAFAAYGVSSDLPQDPSQAAKPATKLVTEEVSLKLAAVPTPSVEKAGTDNKALTISPTPTAPGADSASEVVALAPKLDRFVQSEKVRKGETISGLLARLGVSDPELVKFIAKNPIAQPFVKMQTGRLVQAEIGQDGKIVSLHYNQPAQGEDDAEFSPGTRITLSRGDEGYVVRKDTAKLVSYTDTRLFTIRSTLEQAASSNRVPESVANQIVDLFSDVIDFEKEARRGDRVKVIYETLADPTSLEAPTPGRVLAVEWLSGRKLYSAIWHADPLKPDNGEYFGFDGKSLQKSFLRYPIEFARISSEFSESRKHPIFQDWRAHKGVDFSAPIGTKVRATGEGIVEFIGTQRGYGNVITLTHGKYTTVYAHLNEFVDGLKEGSKVKQGDIIGFVGRTGWATGPHLHYEFKINGEQADPLTAELPGRGPLDPASRKKLAEKVNHYKEVMAQMGSQTAGKLPQFQ